MRIFIFFYSSFLFFVLLIIYYGCRMLLEFNKKNIFNCFKWKSVIFSIICAFFLEFYVVFVENYIELSVYNLIWPAFKIVMKYFSVKHMILFFILFFILFTVLLNPKLKIKVFSFIYNNRFLLAVLTFIVCVILQIHGSSLAALDISNSQHKALFGVARTMRSDEFNVNTPFALSQYFNNFGYYSDIVRGVPTDMFISYGQPVLDIAVIFRPFHWGYLLLSQGYGLSAFWMGRLIALFVVSFEFGMLITNKNKKLSLAYTFLLTFSPLVQWWYAVNMLVEMLIFGQLFILLTDYYMNLNDYKKRLIITIALIICAGAYILAMYPAWEIPLAYVFLAFFIGVIYKNHKKFTFTKKDLLLLVLFVGLLVILLGYIFLKSQTAIQLIMNTTYPGSRVYNGGLELFNVINPFVLYIKTIFAPITVGANDFILVSFFPLGIILFVIVQFIQRKKDVLLYLLILVYILLLIYFIFTLPSLVGQLTLLNNTVAIRLISIIYFVDLLILIRSLSLVKLELRNHYKLICFIVAVVFSAIAIWLAFGVGPFSQVILVQIVIAFIVFALSFFFILTSCFNRKYLKGFLVMSILISLLAGGLLNPIESGVDYYFDQPIINETESIVQKNPDALWVVESPIYIDELIPVGAHTLNSVNIYPNEKLWSKLDPSGQNNEVYNRYAHICVNLQNNEDTSFGNPEMDTVSINLNINDIKNLNITYILTDLELENFSNANVKFVKIYEDKIGNKIYEVK